jgi:hypothetical protein
MFEFWCGYHNVRLEVNEIGHVFIYEDPEGSNLFDVDSSGMVCPTEVADDDVEQLQACVDSWVFREVT